MRALSRNTRRVTALTLAAALVIAVYLNWQYARTDTGIATDEEAQVVSAEPVQSDTVLDGLPTEAETVSAANKNYGEAQLVSVASDSGAKFFEEARLKREKAHDEAMDTLQKTMKSSSLSAEEKKDCTAQLTAGLEDLHAENEIETLIKAKGFADCLCFLQSGRADLTVMTSGDPLTAAQVAQNPGRRAQQEQCDGPEHHGGGSKIKSVSLRPEGIGLEKEPVVWSDRVFQTSIEINPALMV